MLSQAGELIVLRTLEMINQLSSGTTLTHTPGGGKILSSN